MTTRSLQVFDFIMNDKKPKVKELAEKLGIKLKNDEWDLEGKPLLKVFIVYLTFI